MTPTPIALLAFLLSSSTPADSGSLCTKEPITIEASQKQRSTALVDEPFLYSRRYESVLTIGRKEAFRLLRERAKENEFTAKSASLLLSKLSALPKESNAVDENTIPPNFDGLKGKELNEALLIANELNILFLRALVQGTAAIGDEGKSYDTTIQRYSAILTYGKVQGFRVLEGSSTIYDYCFTAPRSP